MVVSQFAGPFVQLVPFGNFFQIKGVAVAPGRVVGRASAAGDVEVFEEYASLEAAIEEGARQLLPRPEFVRGARHVLDLTGRAAYLLSCLAPGSTVQSYVGITSEELAMVDTDTMLKWSLADSLDGLDLAKFDRVILPPGCDTIDDARFCHE